MSEPSENIDLNSLELPTALNYEALVSEAIDLIQQLSGGRWTDYNEHDPGVTTLEQVAYAMTDLGFRAYYPIEDILEQDPEMRDKGAFFTARDIFTVNPVIIDDYRKLIIDQVNGVRNAWMRPLVIAERLRDVDGLFLVFLELDDDEKYQRKEVKESVKESVKLLLSAKRNLMEDCVEVVALEKMKLKIDIDIEVSKEADLNKVHAEVVYALYQFLAQSVIFYSLDQLEGAGEPVEEIFEGPQMTQGFIPADQLQEKMHVIYNSELVGVVKTIEEVTSVRKLDVKPFDSKAGEDDPRILKDGVMVDLNCIAYLDINNADDSVSANYYKGNLQYFTNPNAVQRELDILRAMSLEDQAGSQDDETDIPVPTGQFRNLEKYYSIQNQFPGVYGIGQMGLPGWVSDRRKAQAKQFKGYLLFFEQILANHLSQLANVNSLFSLDKSVDQTYFSQPLTMVPDVEPLLTGVETSDFFSIITEYLLPPRSTPNPEAYESSLEMMVTKSDSFVNRRGRFLDHLLARFAESLVVVTAGETSKESALQNTDPTFEINNRINFLDNYPEISANRAMGYDPSQEYWGQTNISTMEKRVKLVLGIDLSANRLTLNTGLDIIFDGVEGAVNPTYDNSLFEVIDRATAGTFFPLNEKSSEKPMMRLSQSNEVVEETTEFKINRGLYEQGSNWENYRYGANPQDGGASFLLIFHPGGTNDWWIIGRFGNFDNLFSKLAELIQLIIQRNHRSEGFYTVDHLQLRPQAQTQEFGVLFPGKGADAEHYGLKSIELVEINQLQGLALDILSMARDPENFQLTQESDGWHLFLMNRVTNQAVALVQHIFEELDQANDQLEYWKEFFTLDNFSLLDSFSWNKMNIYLGSLPMETIAGYLYSQQVSIILPTWPGRFRNQEFQALVEHLFQEAAPASGKLNFLWLDFDTMREYEILFSQWLQLQQDPDATIEDRNHQSNDLLRFLMKNTPNIDEDLWISMEKLLDAGNSQSGKNQG